MEKKGVLVRARTLLPLMAVLLVLTNSCMAATLAKTNSSYRCNGGLGGCLLADDFDVEFMMDSHFSRILAGDDPPKPTIGGTRNPHVSPCDTGPGYNYNACQGQKHAVKQCGTYSRPPCP